MVLALFCEAMPGQPPSGKAASWDGCRGWENGLHKNPNGLIRWKSAIQRGQEEVEKKQNGMMGMRRAAAGRSHAEEETDPESEGRALRCSLGLGVYGNSSKHDISSAASRTTPASNNSPAVQ